MQSRWKQKTIDEAGFKALVEELQAHEAWNVVPPEQPYGSLERLVATEVGLDLAWFLQDAVRALHDLQLVIADRSSAVPWEPTAAGESLLAQCQALGQAYRGVEDALRQTIPGFDATFRPPPPAPAPQPEQVDLRTAVWQVVKQRGPCTNTDVAKALDKRPTATHKVLQALVQQGKVARKGHDYM